MMRQQLERRRVSSLWTPSLFLVIGAVGVALFVWSDHVSDLESTDSLRSDVLMDLQIHATEGHLLIEELLDGHAALEGAAALESLGKAIQFVEVLLEGGVNEQGLSLDPLEDPSLRGQAVEIRSHLLTFREEARRLMTEDDEADVARDHERHDSVYRAVLAKARTMEHAIETDGALRQRQFHRLLVGMMVFWVGTVFVTAAMLFRVEGKRREAGEELVAANEQLLSQSSELEEHRRKLAGLVEERTAELSTANERLREEVAERTKTAEVLVAKEKDIRSLSLQLLDAQETERRRISMELHDGLGQALNVTKLQIRSLWKGMGGDQADLKDDCLRLMEYMDGIIENVRRIALDLSPAVIEEFGLAAALERLCKSAALQPSIRVSCNTEDIDPSLSREKKIVVYRIIQEAVSNASRHSGARNIAIQAKREGGRIRFSVEDDGQGFDVASMEAETPQVRHLGLTTMRERSRVIEGEFQLTSRIGEGTSVTVSIPAADEG